jgi:hypothetical protein
MPTMEQSRLQLAGILNPLPLVTALLAMVAVLFGNRRRVVGDGYFSAILLSGSANTQRRARRA